jgi:hypothetical protein
LWFLSPSIHLVPRKFLAMQCIFCRNKNMDAYVNAILRTGEHDGPPKFRAALRRALRCMRSEYVQHYVSDGLHGRTFETAGEQKRAVVRMTRALMADFNTALAYTGVLVLRTRSLRRTMPDMSYFLACMCISNQMLDDIAEESTSCLYTAELPTGEVSGFGKSVAAVFRGLNCSACVKPEEIAEWTATYVRAFV